MPGELRSIAVTRRTGAADDRSCRLTDAFKLKVLHKGWNTFGIATLKLPDGGTVDRALEDHGAATCVLPYDPERRVAVLVRQVRVAPMFWGEPGEFDEAPAGGLDGETPEVAARREVMEETGIRVGVLDFVVCSYAMPSVSSERLHLYLAPFSLTDRVADGGGLADEGEQVTVLEVPLAELWSRAERGDLLDMKTLVLVQALRLRRPDLFEAPPGV